MQDIPFKKKLALKKKHGGPLFMEPRINVVPMSSQYATPQFVMKHELLHTSPRPINFSNRDIDFKTAYQTNSYVRDLVNTYGSPGYPGTEEAFAQIGALKGPKAQEFDIIGKYYKGVFEEFKPSKTKGSKPRLSLKAAAEERLKRIRRRN